MGPQLFQSVVPKINVSTMGRREWRDIDFIVSDYIAALSSWRAAGGQNEKAKSKKSEQNGTRALHEMGVFEEIHFAVPVVQMFPV